MKPALIREIWPKPAHPKASSPKRPGKVAGIKGIIFQSDPRSILGAWIIRPVQNLDRLFAGIKQRSSKRPLAIHVGIRVVLEDKREFVVEQLFGSPWENFVDGLNWTPLADFRERDHEGWDATVPATAFRKIEESTVEDAIDLLNIIPEKPFFGEDCVMLVERAFGKRRMFADSPFAHCFGIGFRVADPALPLLRQDVKLDSRTEHLLQGKSLRELPDPKSQWDAPNAHRWFKRAIFFGLVSLVFGYFTGAMDRLSWVRDFRNRKLGRA